MKLVNLVLTTLLAISTQVHADETASIGDVSLGKTSHSAAFNQMKRMIGEWQGKLHQQSGTVVDTNSKFRLVSNGNTIIETLTEDGVEMITTYSDREGVLVIKHYCALGTEPTFRVASMNENSIQLTLDPRNGYQPDHHNFVETMGWTFNSEDDVRVDASLYIDGDLEVQHSIIRRLD